MVKLVLAAIVLAACQGRGDEVAPKPAAEDSAVVVPEPPPADAAEEQKGEPEPPDPGKAIADLGAVSAWQAVVDRGQYLARRGQHGVVYGTLGAAIVIEGAADAGLLATPFTWLVDDTEGHGALAIRVMLGERGDKLKTGDRVALGGAWVLDESRRWYWKVDAVDPLLPATPSDLKEPPAMPGHQISLAKDNDVVTFMLTGSRVPVQPGEGWPVADQLGSPVFALLNLPGERPSFGGQDFRTDDERWQLKRGQRYSVRIGRIRKQGEGKPVLINARTAPIRIK
jgi:hypothetical protein